MMNPAIAMKLMGTFNKFKSKTLKSNEENEFEKQFIDFLKKAVIINGVENSYVDFYYIKENIMDKSWVYRTCHWCGRSGTSYVAGISVFAVGSVQLW